MGRYCKNGRTIEESLDKIIKSAGLRQQKQQKLLSKPIYKLAGGLAICTIHLIYDGACMVIGIITL